MRKGEVEPTIDDDGHEHHPAYAAVGIFTTTGQRHLFGSRVDSHHNYVTLRITRAKGAHQLGWSHHFTGALICEVTLSPAQWAELVSTPNIGSGVPCTLNYVTPKGEGDVPGIATHKTETRRTVEALNKAIEGLPETLRTERAALEATLAKAPKKMRDDALAAFDRSSRAIRDSIPYLASSVHTNLEGAVQAAKSEVEAFVSSAVFHTGLTALADQRKNSPILVLDDSETKRSEGT